MQRYSSYKDSGVKWLGEIPSHWEVKRLNSFGIFSKGGGISRDELQEEGKSAILYGDIYTKYDIYADTILNHISEEVAAKSVRVFCGDILMTGSGETKEDIGKTVVVREQEAYIGGDVILFRQNTNNSSFLSYALNSQYAKDFRYRESKGEIIVHIYANNIKQMYLPLPPLSEQDAIVSYLDTVTSKIDVAIEQQQKMIELLNERKQIIINNAVTKGLDPNVKMKDSGVEWIGEIPEGWEVVKTSYVFPHIGSGTTPKSSQEDYYSEDGFPFLQTGDLNDSIVTNTAKKITEKALRDTNLKIYPQGSLVIAMYGATIGKLGMLGIATAVNQACCVLPESRKMNIKYAFYVFSAAKKNLLLQSKGGGQPNISQDTIKNEKIVVPPIKEQMEIVKRIEDICLPIENAIELSNKQITLLQERKQIIINDVVTGKVKVS